MLTRDIKLRNAGNMPVICPTCQNVFRGQGVHAGDPFVTLHGVVFDIFACGSENRTALRPGSVACRVVLARSRLPAPVERSHLAPSSIWPKAGDWSSLV